MRPDASVRGTMQQADARLQAWVERIWHSHGDEDGPVQVSFGAAPPDRDVVEQYAVVPHPRTVRFLVPMGSRPASVAAFRHYSQTRGPVSRAVRTALAVGFASGLADRAFPHRLVVSVEPGLPAARRKQVLFLAHLAERLGRPDLLAFTAVRQINPNAKPTLELLGPDGMPVGYAKLGTTDATRHLVRTEVTAMTAVRGRLDAVIVPAVLTAGDWGNGTYGVTAPLPADLVRWRLGPESTVEQLASIARSGTVSRGPLAGSSYAARVRADISSSGSSSDVPPVLAGWLDRLERQPATLHFGRMHGDWIPDNLGRSGGRLVVWDWEHSSDDAPVGFDYLHWHFHKAFVRSGLRAAATELDTVAPQLGRLGVSPDAERLVCSLYLLDVCVRRLKLAVGGGGWNRKWYPGLLHLARTRDLT